MPIIEDVTGKIPSTSLIARVDGCYMSPERLNWIVEKKLKVISVVNWDNFLSNNKDIKVDELSFEHFSIEEEDEETKEKVHKKISVAPVGIRRVYSKSRHKFQAVLVKVNDRAVSHAVRIEEKEEKVYTLHLSSKYKYKAELKLTLQKLRFVVALSRILKDNGII